MDKNIKNYESLIFIVMIYMTIDLSSMVFAYKIIKIGPIIGAASSLIFPLTYSIMDVIAEVYGYRIAKKIIWLGFFCDFIFALFVSFISHIPSITPSETAVYLQILGPLLRAVIAQMLGVLTGAFINIYLISKWKALTNGKYFWLRSIGASTIGEAIMLIVSVLIALIGVLPVDRLIYLIFYTYVYKIFFAFLAAPCISVIATILKNKIMDTQHYSLTFNPFNIPNKQDLSSNFLKL